MGTVPFSFFDDNQAPFCQCECEELGANRCLVEKDKWGQPPFSLLLTDYFIMSLTHISSMVQE